MSWEDLEPFGSRGGFLLELEFFLGTLGLLSFANFVQFGLSLSQKLILVSELPNCGLVLLSILKLDTHERKHVISDLVTELEHGLGSLVGSAFNLVTEI